jgi:hypothetical protein
VGRDEPSIILLTETWLSSSIPDSLVSIRGYTLFRRDRFGKRGGGVCMYFANRVLTNFKIQPISGDFRGIEALFLGVHSKTVSFVLGCVYRPPSSSISDDKILIDFIKGLADTSQKIFIFGDFNMPDLLWPLDSSGPFSNSSQLMADLIINSHLCQLVSEPTRFRLNQTPSTLDLIISSDDNSLTNLKYLSPIGISDHVTLGIELQIYSCPRLKTVSFERTVVEWAAVNQHLSVVDWNLLLSNTSMTHNWKVFKTTLQDMIAQHTTRVTFKRSSKKPWIDSKILKLIRKKRSLWRTFRRTGAESDYKTHRAFSNKLSTTIKEARTRYEASIANSKDTKHFHKHIRTQLSGPVGTPQVRDITGSVTDNSDVVADIFADVFSKVFTKESRDRIPAVPGPPNSTFLSDIDFLETVVCEKIRKLKVSKSPGPDLITAKVLSNCAAELSVPLSVLMKQSFRSGVLPPDWRSAIVRPIFKKGDKFDAANYRPVSLTSLVVKAMESIIYDQVVRFLLDCDLIPLQQHGFLPGKSIQSNLLACLADWTREVDNGNSVDVLYLDFSKAFDRVPKRRLISKLQHLGISGNLLAWINAFLSERTFCVRVGESYSRPVRVHSGVPQGSVLGPLLFIAYTADLGCILRSPFAMYADYIKVYNISNQSMALEQDLLAIHDWSCDWLLPLNSDKCGVLHIGNTNPKHIYRINGKELASFDNYRDLGVTVSFDLSWSNHILKITKKANSMLFLLNKVFRKSSPAIFAKLYKTYVRPVLEFANCVWTPVLQRDIQLLESVQRRATRVPFGRSRPQYTARLSLMGIPSLSARRVRGDLLVVFRALSSQQSPIRHLFTLHEGGRTRGHSLKLLKDRFVTTARQYFLTNRIFDQWNSLPPEIVNCKTADSFKAKYDSLLKSRPPDGL